MNLIRDVVIELSLGFLGWLLSVAISRKIEALLWK